MCIKVYSINIFLLIFILFLLSIVNISFCDQSSDKTSLNKLTNSLFSINLKLQNFSNNINNNNNNNNDEDDVKENFILSPIGLSLTLAQVATSANNHWKNYIYKLMSWRSLEDNLPVTINKLLVNLTTPDEIIHGLQSYEEPPAYINITSALFYESNLESDINDLTINILKNNFQSEVYTLGIRENFQESQDIIDNWVNNKTNGEISNFPINKRTTAVILNTIYFEGYWLNPFDTLLTVKDVFMINERKNITIEYMQGQHYSLFANDKKTLNCRFLRLPYQTQQKSIAMYVLSPNDNIENLLEKLTVDKFENLKNMARLKSVDIKIPKLELKSKIKIFNYVKAMHRQQPNEMDKPEKQIFLSNLFLNHNQAQLSDIVQYISLNVNEKGTVVAAASGGLIDYSGFTIRFNVNRPYILIIQDEQTNATLFWGTIYNPNST